jgi:hypothetical protein
LDGVDEEEPLVLDGDTSMLEEGEGGELPGFALEKEWGCAVVRAAQIRGAKRQHSEKKTALLGRGHARWRNTKSNEENMGR